MADLSQLAGLMEVIQGVKGTSSTTKTSGGTTTTSQTQQQDVSDEGISELLQQILAGPGGVSKIGGSARSAGIYNSTSEDLLLGNLYARAANQAELARTPTTSTQTVTTPEQVVTQEIPGVGAGSIAGTLAGTSAISSIMKGEVPFAGAIDGISSILGMGGDSIEGIANLVSGGNTGSSTNFMSELVTGASGRTAGAGLGVSGGVSNTAINSANAVAGNSGGMLSNAVNSVGGAGNVISGLGGLLSGMEREEEVLGDPMSVATTVGTGFAAGGPVGAAIAAASAIAGSALSGGSIQDTIGSIPIIGDIADPVIGGVRSIGREIGDAVGTVICTALMYKGHLDKELYKQSLKMMHRVSPTTMRGYHSWAVPIAARIRKGNRFWTAIFKPIVTSRTKMLASGTTGIASIKYPLGCLSKYVIEPSCFLLGSVIEKTEKVCGNGYKFG